MNQVSKTLYIPLYGKARVSRRGIILRDPKAQQIWEEQEFPLKRKSRSPWLCFYMGMRSAVFDRWTTRKMATSPDATVLHIGCGLDSRYLRTGEMKRSWYDLDLPHVIEERRRYFYETEYYRLLSADLRDPDWLSLIPGDHAIVVMEGVSMYLSPEELTEALRSISARFDRVDLLMDCYSVFAARASRYKNPINDVGVTQVYGLDDPLTLQAAGLRYLREHTMTPEDLICQLSPWEQKIFRLLYAGKAAGRLYHLYEYRK